MEGGDGEEEDSNLLPDQALIKRMDLEMAKQSVADLRATIEAAANKSRPEKMALVNRLIEGDEKYAGVRVNRTNVKSLLDQLKGDQALATDSINRRITDLESEYPGLKDN